LSVCLFAQSPIWKNLAIEELALARNGQSTILPKKYSAVQLSANNLTKLLAKAQPEFSSKKGLIIPIPMPDGSTENYEIWQSSIMEAGLANRYPAIQTYKGKSVEHPAIIGRFSWTNRDFRAAINTQEGMILIDPISGENADYYTSYYAKDATITPEMATAKSSCGTVESPFNILQKEPTSFGKIAKSRNNTDPVDLYVYRAAIASSGEYAQFHNADTKEEVLAEIVATMNRVNLIFERDLAMRMVLIEETDSLLFLDPATDPYSDGQDVARSYGENPAAIEKIIPPDQFDIGHVFVAGCGSGVVGIGGGKVCDASKSLGISCQNSFNDAQFAFNIVAHEMGHQLYANHSWSSCPGNEEQQSSGTSYEPGSGSTIMSYAGACGSENNLQNTADGYFHVANIEEMLTEKFVGRTSNCPEVVSTGNTLPAASLSYENGFYIPISTPFELTGNGIDPEGDVLTYSWEQFNLGPVSSLGSPIRSAPIFRSFSPSESPTRTFPRMSTIINNRMDDQEVLPTYSRNLTFRFTVRDNHPVAGGVNWATLSFEATEQAGPFWVEFPNAFSDTLTVGAFTEIRWDVANTDGNLVNCQKVNIKLSTDGGATFPITLIENTANDGAQMVTIPDAVTDRARIRVEAADNVFFDISNVNTKIVPAREVGFSFSTAFQEQQVCLPAKVALDVNTLALAGFVGTVNFSLENINKDISAIATEFPQLVAGQNGTIVLDFPADFPTGPLTFKLTGTAMDLTTVERPIQLNLVSNQFTGFALSSPANGTSGIGLPIFEWVATPDASSYEIEIATNPSFGTSVVETAQSITENSFTPTSVLDQSTIYYWRVRPVNDCGDGPNSEIFAFQTQNLSCTEAQATEVPKLISALGTPTIESKMTVTQNFVISDLNVPNIRGSHDWISHIRTSLVSPAGTEVILFGGRCPGSVPFNVGFDDESPTTLPCPPINGMVHQPVDSLSAFDGESTFGEWTMRIEVTNTDGEGGALDDWRLEFCGNITVDPPNLVTNELLPVKPRSGRLISSEFLLTEDANNTANELVYT
ncbi:MAG: reprolysin-like metallopeptidase, partial [Bacteroidota bacterium]